MGFTTERISNSDRAIDPSPVEKRAAYLAKLLALTHPGRDASPFVALFQVDSTANLVFQGIETLQNQAAARILELAIPSPRDENWRFTDLSKLLALDLAAAAVAGQLDERHQQLDEGSFVPAEAIAPYCLPGTSRLVFVDGVYAAHLSDLGSVADTITLGQGSSLTMTALESLAKLPDADEVFTTLNTASFQDVAVIRAQPNAVLAQPIHLLFVSIADRTLAHPRCWIRAETGSNITLIEDYVSLGEGSSFTNAVTEVVLGENTVVNHSRIQRENAQAVHIGKTAVIQARDSRYCNIAVQLGGGLSRHNLEVHHQGTQVQSNVYGLAIAAADQLMDTHSNIQYNEPHCQSNQLYKAIATDRGRSVFNGRINVPQKAQQTNATQLNRNLLLSHRARIDTKPQLEIVADNVKCTHGATVSQLEDNQVFYLQSRGIDRVSAQKLLIEAFALEILHKLPSEHLRQTLATSVMRLTEEVL
ncbi:MAG: Fe-S cluster assembly protein SufD [Synechococcales cyanobacterium CRU_2_2]|nr:Fe-S cluster assembly protein SufD [Synechococcales cyanobacterium CRU_2_2]